MDINVKVTVDLGDKTLALVNGTLAANAAVEQASNAVKAVAEKYADDAPAQIGYTANDRTAVKTTPVEEAPKRTRRTKAEIEAAKEPEAVKEPEPAPVEEPDAPAESADKLEAIKAEVTKYVKKGNSADIKTLLSHFGAPKASELAVADYDAFRAMLDRYGKGESIADIIAGNDLA